MRSILECIDPLDRGHFRVNGVLIDVPAINHWYETTPWKGHGPAYAVQQINGYAAILALTDRENWDPKEVDILLHSLMDLKNYGFPIREEAFHYTYKMVFGRSGSGITYMPTPMAERITKEALRS